MNFKDYPLKPEKITDNVKLRTFFKLLLNSLLGKLSQDPSPTITRLLRYQEQLDALINDPSVTIKDITILGEKAVQVNLATSEAYVKPHRRTSIGLGAYVTAFARIYMECFFQKVKENEGELLYTG